MSKETAPAPSIIRPLRVAIIGTGSVAPAYVDGLARLPFARVDAVAGRTAHRVEALQRLVPSARARPLAEILADDTIDALINLTPPGAHYEITSAGLDAGKHVISEKPLALDVAHARRLTALADRSGRLLVCAPDTFLGPAGQTARHVVDAGEIGEVISAAAFIAYRPAEQWHPNPRFLYSPGGGPLLDRGAYDVAALVNILGPVAEVQGMTRVGKRTREVTAPDRRVDVIEATVPTHTSATLRFESGVLCTLFASFDAWPNALPRLELYGTSGTLSVPDPNHYDGEVRIRRGGRDEAVSPRPGILGAADPRLKLVRGAAAADLALAREGSELRASARLALHTLDVLQAIQASDDERRTVRVADRVDARPSPLTSAELALLEG